MRMKLGHGSVWELGRGSRRSSLGRESHRAADLQRLRFLHAAGTSNRSKKLVVMESQSREWVALGSDTHLGVLETLVEVKRESFLGRGYLLQSKQKTKPNLSQTCLLLFGC